jgi:hypothetical protein
MSRMTQMGICVIGGICRYLSPFCVPTPFSRRIWNGPICFFKIL